ncbi:DUF599 domain-containing protein [Azospirillum rugosum]|uniref:Membrane protein n=1 Tax=Azospirillum rugosum TaxID=416170 RepID=A0ABS4SI03_9PROT|nr:DUF599 domain-containing protein [Azospirillum rugosum]MBP2292194.1 putative membrane protein [Azospirillum rugosum]MDQ0525670.1 putative membrane protein [Azospirillum rugosum]
MFPSPAPSDLSLPDILAFFWFWLCWVGFTVIQDRLLSARVAVNQHLKLVRRHWMRRMLDRDNRIMDSQLVGHTMHSCTFFASTNMLVLAGLVGALGAVEHAHDVIGNLTIAVRTSREFFELKMLLLVAIFTFGFFKFTWALRQYNYCCALIGSAPLPPVPEPERSAMADTIAEAMTLAVTALNGGMRAYYFAMAALGWMLGPWVFMLGSAAVVIVLTRRQGFSATEKVIRVQADALEKSHL